MADSTTSKKQRRVLTVEAATSTIEGLMQRYQITPLSAPPCPAYELLQVEASTDMSEQPEIGTPGTRVWAGRLDVEPNPRYQPYYVRGQWGQPGLYEEFYRSEPLIYDAVQGHTETQVSGLWELQAPSVMPEGLEGRIAEFVDYHHGRLMGIEGGWSRFVEHAASFLIFGFAPFEIIWGYDEGAQRNYIARLSYREPSTLERWYFDQGMRHVVGAQFRPGGTNAIAQYELFCAGESLTDCRLMVCNLAARGLNIEGISPIRPALHYIQLKQLILRIAAVTAEKYGVPVTYIYEDPAAFSAMMQTADDEEMADLYDVVAAMRAIEGATITLPGALRIGQISPSGAMPSFKELVDYCDQMILSPFSNEGSLLGLQSSVGSYALGEVKERDTLRSAPYYARKIAEPINDLIRMLAIAEFGDLPEYPRLTWRVDGMEDGSAWLKDAIAVFGGPIGGWPEAAQEMALAKMGLPPDTLARQVAESQQPAQGLDALAPLLSMADGASKGLTSALLDDAEADLTAAFRRIQRDQQARWRELIRDNETSQDVLGDREVIRAEFLPRYTDAVIEVMRATGAEGQASVAEVVGVELNLDLALGDDLLLLAASIAEEAFNRVMGVMTDAEQQRAGGDRRRTVPVLAASTLGKVASRLVSSSFNAGRDQAVQEIMAQQPSDKPVWAEYSSVLDGNTCSVCEELDGQVVQVGSQRYKDISPPHKCLGGHRCRCIWIYKINGQRVGVIDGQI